MEQIRIHILDLLGETPTDRVETWTVGKDITPEEAQQRRDPETGDIYVILALLHGKPVSRTVPKEIWRSGKAWAVPLQLTLQTEAGPSGEDGPSLEFYLLPIGFGIAFGLFETGLLLHWAIEAAALSVLWGVGTYVLRGWKYRAWAVDCTRRLTDPSPGSFMLLQTISTAAVVFGVAAATIGIRWLLR